MDNVEGEKIVLQYDANLNRNSNTVVNINHILKPLLKDINTTTVKKFAHN